MASLAAYLLVEGHQYPVTHCTFGVQQQTYQRGRVSAKVRYEPVHLTVDVPADDFLLAWAADAHKRVAANLVFLNAAGGSALESVQLPAAYCVSYTESFQQGDAQGGAYQAVVTLVDPSGFTLQAGGPVTAFTTPSPGTHGAPPLVTATTTVATTASESGKLVPGTPAHQAARWAAYQAKHAGDPNAWSQARWEKQYVTNMANGTQGIAREATYRLAMNAESKTLKTPLTFRQIDLFKRAERYCGQLKTGKMSLTKQARLYDIPKDAVLVSQLYEVEYILEKGASKPFLDALDQAGVTYKIGPQIP